MEDSFRSYREAMETSAISDSDQSDADNDVDPDSDSDSSCELMDISSISNAKKKTPGKPIIIPDSDPDSDTESDKDEESFVIKPKKVGPVKMLSFDSDSGDERDERDIQSAATRLSIFGIKPPGDNSNESDFIKSDDEEEDSSSDISLSDMAPNPHIGHAPAVDETALKITNLSSNIMNMSVAENVPNDSVNAIEISSEDELPDVYLSSPKDVKPKSIMTQPTIKSFVRDHTYPNANVVYVSKQIYDGELKKLDELRQDLNKVKKLLQSMNLEILPDKGFKLSTRCEEIKVDIKKQAEKIGNMIIETAGKIDNPISWDDIKTGSEAVQPRNFGTQAMNTHNTQRLLTLERLNALHSSLDSWPSADAMAEPPKNLTTKLMAHQLHALAWLSWRETQQPKGGILADDMGLGKTLTMISLILSSKEKNLNTDSDGESDDIWTGKKNKNLLPGGTLVICPASLLKQWQGEVETHCKRHVLKVEIHHGIKREVKAQRLTRNDIVLTTYNIIQRDHEKSGVLMNIKWRRIILDEAHIVRNHKSLTAQAIFALNGLSRWCLTGTPVHNKDLDLFSLLKFLRCSPFDDIVLWKKWIDNKSTGGHERLGTVMKTLLLRRTKQQLQEQNSLKSLPDKTMHFISVTLSKEEMKVYQKVLVFSKTLFAQFLHQRIDRNNYLSNNKQNKEKYYRMHKKMLSMHGTKEVKSHEILVLLLRLRQICCHSGLIHAMLDDEYCDDNLNTTDNQPDALSDISKLILDDDNDNEDILEHEPQTHGEALSANLAIRQVLHVSNPVFDKKNVSAKISAVMNCLQEKVFVHKGDKAIVVSQWTGMLDIIRDNLTDAGIKTSTLSGKIPVMARQDIVKDFNSSTSSFQVLLLSLCAGGVGLNLVGANHLLLTDLHWNPQLEAQAQDRIYRVGQTKSVHIYKFVCLETVESSIKLIQDKKLALADNILTGVKTQSSKLTIEDLKLMFNMT